MSLTAALSMGGSLIGGLLGNKGARQQNAANAKQAKKNREFQERMSSTAHQREVIDLRAAGLNPILSASKGASTPSGAQANMVNALEPMANSAKDTAQMMANINLTRAQTEKVNKETQIMSAKGTIEGTKDRLLNKALNKLESSLSTNSAYDLSKNNPDYRPLGDVSVSYPDSQFKGKSWKSIKAMQNKKRQIYLKKGK